MFDSQRHKVHEGLCMTTQPLRAVLGLSGSCVLSIRFKSIVHPFRRRGGGRAGRTPDLRAPPPRPANIVSIVIIKLTMEAPHVCRSVYIVPMLCSQVP